MLTVNHSPTHLFSHVHFSLSSLCQLEWLSHLQQSPVPLQFHFLMWLLLLIPCPLIGHFIFRGLVYFYQSVDRDQVLCVGHKHGITLIPAYIPTHLTVWRLIICPSIWSFHSGIFSLRWLKQLLPLDFSRGGSAGILLYHSMPALLHQISTTSGDLGIECLPPFLDVSGKLCVSYSCISSSSSVHVSGRTCQRSTQTVDLGGTMLDGGFLAPHSSQHIGRCSSVVSCHKRSHHGCFTRPGAQGSAISAFNPLAVQWYVLSRQGSLPQSVRWWWRQPEHLCQRPANSVGRNGRLVCSTGCTKQCYICP